MLLWASLPPLGWGPLALVAPLPFLWALRKASGAWSGLAMGLLFGLSFFFPHLEWIRNAAWIAWVALALVLALYPAIYGLGLAVVARRAPVVWWVTAVGGWALMEFLRARFPLGGFPWGLVGYAGGEIAWFRASAQWVGTSGLSVASVGVAAGLVLAAERPERGWRPGWVAAGLVPFLLLTLLGGLFPARAEGPGLRVAIIQGNAPCPGLRCVGERQEIFQSHLALTRSLEPGSTDLVVWPESSTGFDVDPVLDPDTGRLIAAEAERLGAYLLVGGDRPVGDRHFINANLLFGPDGRLVDEYAKLRAVPFGEYVPAREFFDFVPELSRVPRDMIPGPGPVVFRLPGGVLGSVISYEGAFARIVRGEVLSGAEAMVVATNEATYERSPASDQFIGMTRMRAAENGMFLVHAAITGRSAFIDPTGEVGERTDLFEAEILIDEIRYRKAGPTVYARFGDWLQGLAVIVMLGALAMRRDSER